jgi:hypothetical protein
MVNPTFNKMCCDLNVMFYEQSIFWFCADLLKFTFLKLWTKLETHFFEKKKLYYEKIHI